MTSWCLSLPPYIVCRLSHIVPLLPTAEAEAKQYREICIAVDEQLCQGGRADAEMLRCPDCQRSVHRSCLYGPSGGSPPSTVTQLEYLTSDCDFQIMNGHSWTRGKISSEFTHGRRSSLNEHLRM